VTVPAGPARSLLRETSSAQPHIAAGARRVRRRGAAAALSLLLLLGAAFLWHDSRDLRRAERRDANSIEGRVIEAMPPSAGPGLLRTEAPASAPAASASAAVDPPAFAQVPRETASAAPIAVPTESAAAATASDTASAAAVVTTPAAVPASAAAEAAATALQAPTSPVARERRSRSDTVAASAPAAAALRAATAREACGDHVMFAIVGCLERECRRPRFSQDPECVEINAAQRVRQE
jgi:hypothetical protein